jgi:hypothetical protein
MCVSCPTALTLTRCLLLKLAALFRYRVLQPEAGTGKGRWSDEDVCDAAHRYTFSVSLSEEAIGITTRYLS